MATTDCPHAPIVAAGQRKKKRYRMRIVRAVVAGTATLAMTGVAGAAIVALVSPARFLGSNSIYTLSAIASGHVVALNGTTVYRQPVTGGPQTILPPPAGTGSVLFLGEANDRGIAVGTVSGDRLRPAVWDVASGTSRVLPYHTPSMAYAEAWGVSFESRVVGIALFNATPEVPFSGNFPALWSGDHSSPPRNLGRVLPAGCELQICGLPGYTVATDVNDREEVIGYNGNGRAFRWTSTTKARDLPTFVSGVFSSVAHAINESGAIVGWARHATGTQRAALWPPTAVTSLPHAPAELVPPAPRFGSVTQSVATDINDNDDVLVFACTTGPAAEGTGCYSYVVVDGNWTRLPNSGSAPARSLSGRTPSNTIEIAGKGADPWAANVLGVGGNVATWTLQLVDENQPPTAVVGGPYSGLEGAPILLNFGGSDPNAGDHLTYHWDLGDGTIGSGLTPPASHTYADNPTAPLASYAIRLTVDDGKGGIDTKTTTATVANVRPAVTAVTAPSSVDEGSTITFSAAAVADPSTKDTQQGFTYDFACGADAFDNTFTASNSSTCPAGDGPGAVTVRVVARDKDGGVSGERQATVIVNNVAPTATLVAPTEVNEGTPIEVSLAAATDKSAADIAAGLRFAIACAPVNLGAPGPSNTATCPTADDAVVAVTGRVVDQHGGASDYTRNVTVRNVPPALGAFTGLPPNLDPVPVTSSGGTVSLTIGAPFTDPGSNDTHTTQVAWDAGLNPVAGDAIPQGARTLSATKALTPGVYTITVKIEDDDRGTDQRTVPGYVVVYDPSAGFVTGGGWILSPNGACDVSLCSTFTGEGKASFGFVSRYRKGQTAPEGNTEFQFDAGGLSFKSTRYDWLVVAGAKAQYKGYGSINGSGERYGFLLTAFDGTLDRSNPADRFRIKIWDTTTGVTVYDNRRGSTDDSDAAQVIGAGSIVIHAR